MITVTFTEISDRSNSWTETFPTEKDAVEVIHEAWADGFTARKHRSEVQS